MANQEGGQIRMYYNTGTAGSPVYSTVSCESELTASFGKNLIDVTCKDSNLFTEHIHGDKNLSISFSGFTNEGTTLDKMLTDVSSDGIPVAFEVRSYSGNKYTGLGTLSGVEITGAHGDAMQFSATLESSGQYLIEAA